MRLCPSYARWLSACDWRCFLRNWSQVKLLVACEQSGAVRRAFRALGHDAWSCDILPAEDGSPHHIQGSVIDHGLIGRGWDAMIAFPDCTYLTVSGARWMSIPWRKEAQQWALAFVRTLWALPIEKKALENPVGRLSTLWRKPTQIIQPWMFGHGETKSTCLWLDGFPPLKPTKIVDGREGRIWKMGPSPERQKERSRTYAGIAQAMADQWGNSDVDTRAGDEPAVNRATAVCGSPALV